MKSLAVALVAMAAVALPSGAHAQSDWPSRAVRIISPAAAGGTSDTLGRILAKHLGDIFNQRFYVENRGGAGGLIGSAAVVNSDPDGYTFLTSNVGYVIIAPSAAEKPPFDTMRDLTHIAYLGGPPNVFIAHPSMGVKTMKEFMDYAKKEPLVDYVSPGLGTLGNLIAERFGTTTGVKFQHIPSKGGGSAIMDVVAGTVKFGSIAFTSALAQIRAGSVVPLAVSSAERMPEFPDVPTLKELGYTDFVDTIWFGISAPANLPKEIAEKMNKAILQILEMPEVKERMLKDGVEVRPMTTAQFTSFMADEVKKWAPLAKSLRKK